MWAPYSLTTDGYETQFAVNHLGHFALVTNLLNKLKSAPGGARVVTLSSRAHRYGYSGGVRGLFTEHFRDAINDEDEYSAAEAYGQSKLCNILMTSELARRFEGTNVYANAAHPGFVATSLLRHIPDPLASIAELLAMASLRWSTCTAFVNLTNSCKRNCRCVALYRTHRHRLMALSRRFFWQHLPRLRRKTSAGSVSTVHVSWLGITLCRALTTFFAAVRQTTHQSLSWVQ